MSERLDPNEWQAVAPQVMQLAAQGLPNDEIAARMNCGREVIKEWRERFYGQCLVGLDPSGAFARSASSQRTVY